MRRQLGRDALMAVLHVAVLLALVTLLRPLFFRGVSEDHYRAPSILWSMVKSDWSVIAQAAKRHSPAFPELLSFLVPTVLFALSKRKLRWEDWEHGKALRLWIMAVIFMLAWSGSTFPFNHYLNRGHFLDRGTLVALAALSWRYPIMVPLAVRWAIVMIKESYIPIPQDDFDFRAPAEFVIVFGIFVWASASRSFKPIHFMIVGIGSFASYYYSAGLAKWNFGPPHSWLLENHVSNMSVAAYVRGWMTFIPEETYMKLIGVSHKLDTALQGFTLFVELGSLVAFFLHPRITRWWFLGLFLLNFGIFMMTGVCFWKWFFVSVSGFVWCGRVGRPLVEKMHELKLPLVLGIVSIYYCNERIWFYPQTHVVWYDSAIMENYEMYAVGESGRKYLIGPNYFGPSDMHWAQGNLCYATESQRALTGIYGNTGNYSTMKRLNEFDKPEQGLAMQRRGRICHDDKRLRKYENFVQTVFGNINRNGGKKHKWLRLIGRPTHIWVFPRHPDTELFAEQEKVVAVELWQTVAYHHGDKIYRTEPELGHVTKIPH
ncbi:MAG: hypothetical protein HOW73_30710 [Polyangiaceae bacterium]|nr:hypothetical protein [Polyangiaceae bacterium]